MAEHATHVPPDPDNPDVGHEHSDVNLRAIVKFGIGLLVFAVLVHAVAAWLFFLLGRVTEAAMPRLTPVARQQRLLERKQAEERLATAAQNPHSAPVPIPALTFEELQSIPMPRLQVSDAADLDALRKEDEAKLKEAWVNEKTGAARIPISEAMRLLADPQKQRKLGLKVRGSPPAGKGGRKGER